MTHTSTLTHLRKTALATLATVALVVTGCSAERAQENEKPTVLTTFTVLQDMAQNVAGEHLTVESLTKPGAEIHEYEPTPSDIKKAHDADLVLNNGLNLESWFDRFLHDSQATHKTVSEGVTPIGITEDTAAGTPNPHAWMSPTNAATYVDNIAAAFTQLDPDHADDYRSNAESYKEQLRTIQDGLTEKLDTLPAGHRALVTCEGAFSYLAHDAGLTEQYLWAVNSDSEVSASRVAQVSGFVRENSVPAVFCESTVSDSTMQQVASDTGARFGGVLYVDSLSGADGDVPTYLDLLRHDVSVITDGLAGS